MTHSYDLNEFFRINWISLRKMAGKLLLHNFDDDDVDTLLSDLALDLYRLNLLKKYDPTACANHGIQFSTVIFRQLKNIIGDRLRYQHAAKRSPDAQICPRRADNYQPPQLEALTVKEFLGRLKPHLSDYLLNKMAGYTGPEYCSLRQLSLPALQKRLHRVREAWTEYSESY